MQLPASTSSAQPQADISPLVASHSASMGNVGQDRVSMSAQEREEEIKRAGADVEAAWKEYEDGDPLALNQAHDARRRMEGLIRGRSADQVARMERERGLV
jgi:hypothetical protein